MKTMRIYLVLIAIFWSTQIISQSIERIEPPNWWTGMHNPELQLLLYGRDISGLEPVVKYPGVDVKKVTTTANPNYLFVYLNIKKYTKPGVFDIELTDAEGKKVLDFEYELREREPGSAERMGFDPSDVLYLITPDRFANGTPANDDIRGMKEFASRDDIMGRHGGDIKGIVENLDYLKEMGFT